MMKVELAREGEQGFENVYAKNGSWKHTTGTSIKILHFNTKFKSSLLPDLATFHGVVGECFRISKQKGFDKEFSSDKETSFKKKIRNHIIDVIQSKVTTEKKDEFKDIVIKLFFEEDGGLIKFGKNVLPYMNYIHDDKQLNETAKFFFEIFLDSDVLKKEELTKSENDNIFYQLIVESLPELKNVKPKDSKAKYSIYLLEIRDQFIKDFNFLASNEELFLKHIEDLFKHYYFFYLTQLLSSFSSFGKNDKLEPIFFSMDWETLSKSRLTYQYGWKKLDSEISGLFAHANVIEVLNYITINGEQVGDYRNLLRLNAKLSESEKDILASKIEEISSSYTNHINVFNTGESWEKCEREIKSFLERHETKYNDRLSIELVSFYKRVKYQFDNSGRKAAMDKYDGWFRSFCTKNYTKVRGILGHTTVITQEYLLFLTKLCVGQEEKIRLNELWEQLNLRGITFDEASKGEIIKLFERINLLEKKSDSGDAQYVKSII